MSKNNITIKDIAMRVGVSPTTVSNVINKRSKRVSEDIITKVNEAIEELGYKRNFSALSLVSNRSNLIGVIIPQTEDSDELLLHNPFYSEFIGVLEYELRKNGYHMILSGASKAENNINYLQGWNIDGVIILGIYEEEFYNNLKEMNIPIILVDSYIKDDFFFRILTDDRQGGYLATKYLLDKGHRNIGIITGSIKDEGVTQKKYAGYKEALEEKGIAINKQYIFEDTVSYDWGYDVGKIISQNMNGITAVFATADILASGLLSSFYETGVNVPNDISIIGFDNVYLSKISIPALTTINQDIRRKAIMSANTMLDILQEKEFDERKIVLPVSIIERNSVREVK